MFKKLFKSRKGAALVEYGLLIAGVALISSAAVSSMTGGERSGAFRPYYLVPAPLL